MKAKKRSALILLINHGQVEQIFFTFVHLSGEKRGDPFYSLGVEFHAFVLVGDVNAGM